MNETLLHTFFVRLLIFIAHASLYLILAQLFSPEAFGAYNMAAITMLFISTVGGFSLHFYTVRKIPEYSGEKGLSLFKSLWVMQMGLLALLLFSVYFVAGDFFVHGLRLNRYKNLLLAAVLTGMFECGVEHLLCFLRGRKKIKVANYLELFKHLFWIPTILFLAWRRIPFSILSLFVFISIGDLLAFLTGLTAIGFKNFLRTPFDLSEFKKALRFSFPLALSTCALFVSRYIHRYFFTITENF